MERYIQLNDWIILQETDTVNSLYSLAPHPYATEFALHC